MKYSIVALCGAGLLVASALAADEKDAPKAEAGLKDTKAKGSYALGAMLAKQFKAQKLELDPESFTRGLRDALADKLELTEAQCQDALQALQADLDAKRAESMKEWPKLQKDYLEANKKKEGVKTLESGLQYRVIKEGTGKIPTDRDSVTVHYKGTLTDGTEFDSSYKRGQPVQFGVTRVIAGWTEALQLMKVGSKWELVIPAELAYRNQQKGQIPPNSTLIFEVELLGVN